MNADAGAGASSSPAEAMAAKYRLSMNLQALGCLTSISSDGIVANELLLPI
jgi:hypothetical protein